MSTVISQVRNMADKFGLGALKTDPKDMKKAVPGKVLVFKTAPKTIGILKTFRLERMINQYQNGYGMCVYTS